MTKAPDGKDGKMKPGDHIVVSQMVGITEGIVNNDGTITTEHIFNSSPASNQVRVTMVTISGRKYYVLSKILK